MTRSPWPTCDGCCADPLGSRQPAGQIGVKSLLWQYVTTCFFYLSTTSILSFAMGKLRLRLTAPSPSSARPSDSGGSCRYVLFQRAQKFQENLGSDLYFDNKSLFVLLPTHRPELFPMAHDYLLDRMGGIVLFLLCVSALYRRTCLHANNQFLSNYS